jgi:hypothetical protein
VGLSVFHTMADSSNIDSVNAASNDVEAFLG